MLTVLVLILCIVNLTLSAYIVFTVVPNAQRTDNLITKILQIIDLELESPLPQNINTTYDIENIVKYSIADMTTNLNAGKDGKNHYAKITNASLTMNSADKDYAKLSLKLEDMEADIISIFKDNVAKYDNEQLAAVDMKKTIKEQILTDIQTLFSSRFVVDITIDYLIQ